MFLVFSQINITYDQLICNSQNRNLNYSFREPYQFSISGNKWGRVHGIFVGHQFFIIWFDPEHALYE
jgi:hypothetical protein